MPCTDYVAIAAGLSHSLALIDNADAIFNKHDPCLTLANPHQGCNESDRTCHTRASPFLVTHTCGCASPSPALTAFSASLTVKV